MSCEIAKGTGFVKTSRPQRRRRKTLWKGTPPQITCWSRVIRVQLPVKFRSNKSGQITSRCIVPGVVVLPKLVAGGARMAPSAKIKLPDNGDGNKIP